MKISIIIPSFNQGQFIAETIESCLSQRYDNFELIVEDGGSNDATVAYLESLNDSRVLWRSERDKGVVDAVNKGLARATGDILAIQSTDDLYRPDAFEFVADQFKKDNDACLIYGDVDLIDEQSKVIGKDEQRGPFSFQEYLGRFIYIPQPAAFFRRRCLDVAGGWRDSVSYAADADLWLRIACRLPVVHVSRVLGRYRYHDAQRDTQKARILRDWNLAIDDLISSGCLSAEQLRFARMGKHLAEYRYMPSDSWFKQSVALYRAALANPLAMSDWRFPKRHLIPARDPIWRLLSKVKRRLLNRSNAPSQ